jgi:hypothetical protein
MSRKSRPCTACFKNRTTSKLCVPCVRIWRTFGVNPRSIAELRAQLGDLCQICGQHQLNGKALLVDHNHHTDTIRGLLCTRCKMGLGYLNSVTLLEASIRYLKQPEPHLDYARRPVFTAAPIDADGVDTILNDSQIPSLRAKARMLSARFGGTEARALSKLRRSIKSKGSTSSGCVKPPCCSGSDTT